MGTEFIVSSEYQGYIFVGCAQGSFMTEKGEKKSYYNMYVLSPVSTYQSEDYQAYGYKAGKKNCIVTTVEKQQIERHRKMAQRKGFYVKSVLTKPRNSQLD